MKLAVSLVAVVALAAVRDQRQTFRSGTDVVLIDVEVVTKDGLPIEGLKSDQRVVKGLSNEDRIGMMTLPGHVRIRSAAAWGFSLLHVLHAFM